MEFYWLTLIVVGTFSAGVAVGMRLSYNEGYKLGRARGRLEGKPLKPLVGSTRLCDKKV